MPSARIRQQVVDQSVHAGSPAQRGRDVRLGIPRAPLAGLGLAAQQLDEPAHDLQRRLEIVRHDRRELLEFAVRAFELGVSLFELGGRHRQRVFRSAPVDGADVQLSDGTHQGDRLIGPPTPRSPAFEAHESDVCLARVQRQEQDRLHVLAHEGCHGRFTTGRRIAGDIGNVHGLAGADRPHPKALRVDGKVGDRNRRVRNTGRPPLDEEVDRVAAVTGLDEVGAVEPEVHAELTK